MKLFNHFYSLVFVFQAAAVWTKGQVGKVSAKRIGDPAVGGADEYDIGLMSDIDPSPSSASFVVDLEEEKEEQVGAHELQQKNHRRRLGVECANTVLELGSVYYLEIIGTYNDISFKRIFMGESLRVRSKRDGYSTEFMWNVTNMRNKTTSDGVVEEQVLLYNVGRKEYLGMGYDAANDGQYYNAQKSYRAEGKWDINEAEWIRLVATSCDQPHLGYKVKSITQDHNDYWYLKNSGHDNINWRRSASGSNLIAFQKYEDPTKDTAQPNGIDFTPPGNLDLGSPP